MEVKDNLQWIVDGTRGKLKLHYPQVCRLHLLWLCKHAMFCALSLAVTTGIMWPVMWHANMAASLSYRVTCQAKWNLSTAVFTLTLFLLWKLYSANSIWHTINTISAVFQWYQDLAKIISHLCFCVPWFIFMSTAIHYSQSIWLFIFLILSYFLIVILVLCKQKITTNS